ncbi:hypothetical protein [Reichenbachiella sp.]|uniref:hypothetical protein n=1 Tax=Reichenbachiella sp. TaxID=2184521 RepID=UPI003B59620D
MVIEVAKHIDQVKELCAKHKVKELSVIDNNSLRQDQIHFLIRFNPDIPTVHYADNYCQLQDGFNTLFGKEVTLWFEKSFPDLQQLEEVQKSKRLLFEI